MNDVLPHFTLQNGAKRRSFKITFGGVSRQMKCQGLFTQPTIPNPVCPAIHLVPRACNFHTNLDFPTGLLVAAETGGISSVLTCSAPELSAPEWLGANEYK